VNCAPGCPPPWTGSVAAGPAPGPAATFLEVRERQAVKAGDILFRLEARQSQIVVDNAVDRNSRDRSGLAAIADQVTA
jgi:hypothetical protein